MFYQVNKLKDWFYTHRISNVLFVVKVTRILSAMDLTPDARNRSYDRSRFSLGRTQLDSFLSPETTQNQTIQGSQFHFLEENDVLISGMLLFCILDIS